LRSFLNPWPTRIFLDQQVDDFSGSIADPTGDEVARNSVRQVVIVPAQELPWRTVLITWGLLSCSLHHES
jgi:hypothetical protein